MRIRYRALIGATFCATICTLGLAVPAIAATNVMAYDSNGDSVLTRAEFQELQIDSFKVLDADGDGSVTLAEIDSLAAAKDVNVSGKRVMVRDTNGDGAVTQTEYLAVAPGFQKADVNNDGVLAGKEITRVSKFLAQAGY
ncbi:EF-hand domain-containing protein [Celeribacter sp.]|uniref:EF-hand domain-containing protein n=1 Tax=Celeribacter sp. TaxID=1890673 RepID=UPI003A929412